MTNRDLSPTPKTWGAIVTAVGCIALLAAVIAATCWTLYGPNVQRIATTIGCGLLGAAMTLRSR